MKLFDVLGALLLLAFFALAVYLCLLLNGYIS